ncbi:MAG: restriction endonuclease subunit S [Lacunisphaera sp.]|nr:restriction endonuclease subunit S [Lacunisphaera sp.]
MSIRANNWSVVRFSDVVDINPRPELDELGGDALVSFVPMKCVEEESGRFRSLGDRKIKEVRKGYTPFKDGDVLFAKVTPCMENGKAAVVTGLTNGIGFGSTELFALRPKAKLLQKFLFFFINQESFRRSAAANMTGAVGLRRVPKNYLAQQPIPLPPIPDQRRIVAEIEKQFTRLDVGVAALRRVQANLKRYRAAVLNAACEGRLVPTDAIWPQKPITSAILSMDQGWSPKCESEPSDSDTKWAVIKTTAIQNLRYIDAENKALPLGLKPRVHLELMSGDLLVTRAGPRSRVGIACLVKITRPRLMLCDKAYRLRCKPMVASAAFLEVVLNAPRIVDAVNKLKTGISDSGVNLTQKGFGQLLIPLPPLVEQTRIVAEVERRLSVVEELETLVQTNLQRASRLRQSILQQAFTGS